MSVEFKSTQVFDDERMRHYNNDELSVMHCHHYSTLFSQLADDAKLLKGPKLLFEAAEESFYPVLAKYFNENNIDSIEDRASIAEQYYGFVGLGQVSITPGEQGGSAQMQHSHVDEGWIKKWGNRDEAVNFMGQGYLAAAFSAIHGNERGTYQVRETQSIVSGADTSEFTITKK
jgi:predicted hydrocarbon binding protein